MKLFILNWKIKKSLYLYSVVIVALFGVFFAARLALADNNTIEFNNIKIQSSVASSSWTFAKAEDAIILWSTPTDWDIVTIWWISYTFVSVLSNPVNENEILIGNTAPDTVAHLIDGINSTNCAMTGSKPTDEVCAIMTQNTQVSAMTGTNILKVTLTAKTLGIQWNSIEITGNFADPANILASSSLSWWSDAVQWTPQIVDFIPNIPVGTGSIAVFQVTINWKNYIYAADTWKTPVYSIIDTLHWRLSEDPAVTCMDNITKITCSSKLAGDTFSYTSTVYIPAYAKNYMSYFRVGMNKKNDNADVDALTDSQDISHRVYERSWYIYYSNNYWIPEEMVIQWSNPAIAIDPENNIHIAYEQNNNIYHIKRIWNSWSQAELVASGNTPDIEISWTEKIYIAYENIDSLASIDIAQNEWNGYNITNWFIWNSTGSLDTLYSEAFSKPSIKLDNTGWVNLGAIIHTTQWNNHKIGCVYYDHSLQARYTTTMYSEWTPFSFWKNSMTITNSGVYLAYSANSNIYDNRLNWVIFSNGINPSVASRGSTVGLAYSSTSIKDELWVYYAENYGFWYDLEPKFIWPGDNSVTTLNASWAPYIYFLGNLGNTKDVYLGTPLDSIYIAEIYQTIAAVYSNYSNIYTNLYKVNRDNVTNFTWISFDSFTWSTLQSGVKFSQWYNLTDPLIGTGVLNFYKDFLYWTGYFSLKKWNYFNSQPAEVTFYNISNWNPAIPLDENSVIASDGFGNILNFQGIVSSPHWSCNSWTCAIIFDTNSLQTFRLRPLASIVYSNTSPTDKSVTATLTGSTEPITASWGITTHEFTNNWSYTFYFTNSDGIAWEATATVNWIHTSNPVVTLNWESELTIKKGSKYNEQWATWSDEVDGTGAISTFSGSVDTLTLGSYQIEYIYTNSLWKKWSITRVITIVAPDAPTASVMYSSTGLTNQDVIATLTGTNETITGTLSHIFTSNGSYMFTFFNDAGNTGTLLSTVNNIDKNAPVISGKSVSNIVYNWAKISFNFTDANFANGTGTLIAFTGGNIANVGENLLINLSFGLGSGTGTATFVHLTGLTNYEYQISLTDDANNTTINTGSFTTPAASLTLNGGAQTETGSTTMTWGTLWTGSILDMSGTILTLHSNPTDSNYITGSLTISGTNISVTGNNAWNGVLIPPTLINNNSSEAATGSEIGTGVTVIQTIKTGADGASLAPTGSGYFVVSFNVPWYASGAIFDLYRSSDGSTWTRVAPDGTCTLDMNSLCTFKTNHLSYFAPVLDSTPDAFSFIAQTNKEPSTSYESNTITISGTNTGSTINISGGQYRINSWAYTGSVETINSWDTVTIKLTSSSSYSSVASATLTIWWVTSMFSVTTKSIPTSSGGGGSLVTQDKCPNGDTSESYYDGKCSKDPNSVWESSASHDSISSPLPTNAEQVNFTDISNHWASLYIKALTLRWIVNNTDTFNPENNVTRAEFLKMAIKSAEWDTSNMNTSLPFKDVSQSDWFAPYIAKWIEKWLISDKNPLFRPNDTITRSEAAKMLVTMKSIALINDEKQLFSDVDSTSDLSAYIRTAYKAKLFSGQTNEKWELIFRPQDNLTRAEAAKILIKTLNVK